MIKKYVIAGTFAVVCANGVLAAQSTPRVDAQQPSAPSATTPGAPAGQQLGTTLIGCLYREDQIPGRTPNVAERAGILEDYILADALMPNPQGSTRPGDAPRATGTTGNNPGSTGNMYKVEKLPDERLKLLVGKRVEVMGRIDPEGAGNVGSPGAPTPDRGLGPDQINLPEFEATSIREVSGTCPKTPAPQNR